MQLYANHNYFSDITFEYATSDTTALIPSIADGYLTIEPLPNWNGESIITVYASDTTDNIQNTSFILSVYAVNDPPDPFQLLNPTVSDTFSSHIDSNTEIGFTWEDCNDVDNDVTYRLTIELEFFGNTYTDVYDDMNDTTINISANNLDALLSALNLTESAFRWYVDAYDEDYSITPDTGQFFLTRELLEVKDTPSIPFKFAIHQNHPNPFNPVTTLRYDLPEDALVNITINDMMGRQVKTLVNGSQTAGYKSIQWNATNDEGKPVSAGLYLYTIQAGDYSQTKKMVLLK
jgi:hypothetical protein